MATATQNRWSQAINRESGAADDEREAYEKASSFNAQDAVNTSAQGAFASFRERLAKQIRALRETQTGMGRLRTGWGTQDEDELVEGGIEDLNRQIMSNSLSAASMQSTHDRSMAGLASERTGRYYDMLNGQMDRETADANAKRERRGNLASGLGTLLGAGVGFFAGGGLPGAKAGASIGGAAGRIFG